MADRSLQTCVDSLYQIAVRDGNSTSPSRLAELASLCVERFAKLGLPGARTEARIDGGGRPKDWDVAWEWGRKFRLVVSLKSILKNLSGTVPNRIDDLMGETANVQLYSPEIVTGYVVIIDVSQGNTRQGGGTWCEELESRLRRLSGRRAPYWTPSTFEAHAVIRVDFSAGPRLISGEAEFDQALSTLATEALRRNPGVDAEERT